MERNLDRMVDDEAPIGVADVDEAVRFLRLWRVLRVIGLGGAVVGGLVAVATVDLWLERRSAFSTCEARVAALHTALETAPPADATLHAGPAGVVVIDTATVVALVVDGRVVASTLRCEPEAQSPAVAWVTASM